MAQVQAYQNSADFISACSSFLCEREAENNLILGIAGELGTPVSQYRDVFLASAGASTIEGAFLMTPPHKLIASYPASEGAMLAVIDELLATNKNVPGINGHSASTDLFARLWTSKTGDCAAISMVVPCYQLASVSEISLTAGHIRKAAPGDLDLMVAWARGFDRDAKIEHSDDDATLRRKLTNEIQKGNFYIWDDGGAVSMVRASGNTPSGIRIGYVYTPPERRGHGYASSLVAQVSRAKLDEGRKFCFLFTDASNPTSNKIYQRIGYEKVCEFHDYSFTRKS